jgi:hypothetical protein
MIGMAASLRAGSLGLVGLLALSTTQAEAGGLFRKRDRTAVPTVRQVTPAISPAPLGTFTPTPYIWIRGDYPTGSGYSAMGYNGDYSLDVYGPLSVYRATTAPVQIYTRGYDGQTKVIEGTSFSTPNAPAASPVIYPTPGSYYYGFRDNPRVPARASATNWIDQN